MSDDPRGMTAPAAEAIEDFPDLYPRQTSIHGWRVLNLAAEQPTAYCVNTRTLTCTCPDAEYNRESGDVCKHLAVVLFGARRHMDIDDILAYDLGNVVRDAKEVLSGVEPGDMEPSGEIAADASGGDSGGSDGVSDGDDMEAAAAADQLQSAFDDVIDDMQVTANDGLVWFQTGRDTPDEWPYPGMDETFGAVTSPDFVMYVHDGSPEWADGPHEHYESKPGEWWKNCLSPGAVEEYIGEVLE